MSMKIKNENGEEVEVFTAEEVQAREAAAAGTGATALQQANDEKTALLKQIEDLKAAGGEGNHDQQIARLKSKLEDKDKEIANINGEIGNMKKAGVEKTVNEGLKNLSRGDSELEKRLKYEFENYRPHDTSEDGIKERLEKAHAIVKGTRPAPGAFDGGAGERGAGGGGNGGAQKPLDGNAAAIGAALGVRQEDLETKKAFDEGRAAGKF